MGKNRPMDAITLLRNDHRAVEKLFKRFEKAGDRAFVEKRAVVDRIVEELSVHAAIEEQVFYPVARATVPGVEDIALESLEEHHIVKWVLDELDHLDADDERFDAKVTVLIESVRHHVEEEESEFFPKVRNELGRAALADLGEALQEAKKSAPTHPHPRSPDTPPANSVVGAVDGDGRPGRRQPQWHRAGQRDRGAGSHRPGDAHQTATGVADRFVDRTQAGHGRPSGGDRAHGRRGPHGPARRERRGRDRPGRLDGCQGDGDDGSQVGQGDGDDGEASHHDHPSEGPRRDVRDGVNRTRRGQEDGRSGEWQTLTSPDTGSAAGGGHATLSSAANTRSR